MVEDSEVKANVSRENAFHVARKATRRRSAKEKEKGSKAARGLAKVVVATASGVAMVAVTAGAVMVVVAGTAVVATAVAMEREAVR